MSNTAAYGSLPAGYGETSNYLESDYESDAQEDGQSARFQAYQERAMSYSGSTLTGTFMEVVPSVEAPTALLYGGAAVGSYLALKGTKTQKQVGTALGVLSMAFLLKDRILSSVWADDIVADAVAGFSAFHGAGAGGKRMGSRPAAFYQSVGSKYGKKGDHDYLKVGTALPQDLETSMLATDATLGLDGYGTPSYVSNPYAAVYSDFAGYGDYGVAAGAAAARSVLSIKYTKRKIKDLKRRWKDANTRGRRRVIEKRIKGLERRLKLQLRANERIGATKAGQTKIGQRLLMGKPKAFKRGKPDRSQAIAASDRWAKSRRYTGARKGPYRTLYYLNGKRVSAKVYARSRRMKAMALQRHQRSPIPVGGGTYPQAPYAQEADGGGMGLEYEEGMSVPASSDPYMDSPADEAVEDLTEFDPDGTGRPRYALWALGILGGGAVLYGGSRVLKGKKGKKAKKGTGETRANRRRRNRRRRNRSRRA